MMAAHRQTNRVVQPRQEEARWTSVLLTKSLAGVAKSYFIHCWNGNEVFPLDI